MSGGKSSSSSEQTSSQTTATATGTAGDVFQGQTFTINNELPETVVNLFGKLIDLTSQTVEGAGAIGNKAIDTVTQTAQQAAQPDLELVKGYQKQVYYAIAGAVAIFAAIYVFRK